VAYVREKTTTVGGKVYGPYFQLVEGCREGDKVRQRVIAHLGKFATIEDAREYADEHHSTTPLEDLREVCREVHELRDASHYFGQPEEEKRKIEQRVDALEGKILPLFDTLSDEDQTTIRSEYRSVMAGMLNRRRNHNMTTTITEAFAAVIEKYKEFGRTAEVDAEAVRVWESLDRERQVYALNGFVSREIADFVDPAVREHVSAL
jgi:hypothetical protein